MIENRYKIAIERVIPKLEEQILINKRYEYSSNLRNELLLVGYYEYVVKHDLGAFKQRICDCSTIDAFLVTKLGNRFSDYSLPQVTSVLLSDNWDYLRVVYSKLSYNSFYYDDSTGKKKPLSMDEMVLEGESAIWCNTIQHFMANDLEAAQKNLDIIETKTLPNLPKDQKELLLDFEFYKALLAKDKSKCEELLEQLVSPKIHKKRNQNSVLAQYVSQPALGYAKLAWRLGIEVKVDSPLIPKDILPIEPLDDYKIPYDFLKEDFL